jgi:iron complex outermembrane receptor protein
MVVPRGSRWRLDATALLSLAGGVTLALAPAAGFAQGGGGTLAGRVTESGGNGPVSGASVRVLTLGTRAVAGTGNSGDDGRYRVGGLQPGAYAVSVSRIGYQLQRVDTVRIRAGETTTLDVTLGEAPSVLSQVVTTASRGVPEKVLEAPASVSVVTSEQIARTQSVTVADLVRNQPGVNATQGGLAQSNIVARGFNNAFSGSLLVLQDYRFAGVPSLRVNVPFLFTGTNDDIERVEVLLGPAAALYGPNSANGVMHVITKSPFTSQGTTVTLEGGQRSLLRGGLRHASTFGSKVGVKVSGEYFRADDFEYDDRAEPDSFPTAAPAGRRGQPNRRDYGLEKYTGEARLDLRPSDEVEAITTLGHTNVGNGLELTGANGTSQVRNWTYTNLQQRFRWKRLFAQAFINVSDAGNRDSLDTRGTFLLRTGTPIVDQSRVIVGQLQHAADLGSRQTFVYGADYVFTNPRTGNTTNGRNEAIDDVTEYGAYVQSVTRFSPTWELTAAARVDQNDQIDGTFFSPRAALVYKQSPTSNWRVAFNRAFQTPANFSLFLDLAQAQTPFGTVRAIGVNPDDGLRIRRDCAGGIGSLCMRASNVVPANLRGGVLPANAATFYPVMVGAAVQGGLVSRLVASGVPAPAAQAIAQRLASAQPTAAQVGTVLRAFNPAEAAAGRSPFPGNPWTPDMVRDEAPLEASYVNNYEAGYKGILRDRLRVAVDGWFQQRINFITPAQLITPNVFADPAALGPFVGQQVAAATGGQLPAQTVQQIATTITTALAGIPVGTITGQGTLFENRNDVMFSYRTVPETIDLWGSDVAADLIVTPRVTLLGTYSYISDGVFPGVPGGNGEDLRLNAPTHKASAAYRFQDDTRGFGWELRYRYATAFRVNSAVFLGDVPVQNFVDASINYDFRVNGKAARWSINGSNILGNEVPTFIGTPAIGRLITSRVSYTF